MKIFKDPSFDAICNDTVNYGFFGRTGGVSEGLYTSLNCGPGSGDDLDRVTENRRRVAGVLSSESAPVVTLWQCHTAECHYVDSQVGEGEERPQGDALVTDKPNLIIGALTADCGPVLFTGNKKDGSPVIGAAHAGSGGALKGILESTLDKMMQAGAEKESIRACVGPCIMQPSYEVGEEFMRPYVIRDEEAERFFMSGQKSDRLQFDLPGYIAFRLALAGLRRIFLMGVDTYREEESCFSYRRATHRSEPDYGRQISAIVIKA